MNDIYATYIYMEIYVCIYISGHICISGYLYEHICIPTYTRFISALKTCRDWKEVWEKVFHVSRNEKRAGGEIFISDKVDFKNRERL